MKNFTRIAYLVLALAAAIAAVAPQDIQAQGQASYTQTTLSSAIDAKQKTIVVASNSGFAPAASVESSAGNLVRQLFAIDEELFEAYGVVGTTTVTISSRGYNGTPSTSHASGSYVFAGAPQYFKMDDPSGSCTANIQPILPVFSADRASKRLSAFNCIGSNWVRQTLPSNTYQPALFKACTIGQVGNVAYGSSGTSTTTSSTAQLNASVFVPRSIIATGISVLNGSAVDTAMFRTVFLSAAQGSGGTTGATVVANSATTALTGNDAFQAIPFTAVKFISGPATYEVSAQTSGTDVNSIRTVAASTYNDVLASSTTSVYGTLSLVSPTTFTADVGPIACIY